MVIESTSLISLPSVDYSEIIRTESIIPYFQPIVSIKDRRVVGFEALLRGIHLVTSEILPPPLILQYAQENSLSCALQRIMCRKSIEDFSLFLQRNRHGEELFLTLNIDPYLIGEKLCTLRCILDILSEHTINCRNVVLEIVESSVTNLQALEHFCSIIHEYGFLIALDDCGKGHSNLNRIVAIRPDIIKLDKYLIRNIKTEYYKQEVVKSLVSLAHKTGALVIAEGIESEQEAIPALKLNVDMLQGFYLAVPDSLDEISMERINKQSKYLEWMYLKSMKQHIIQKRDILRSYDTVISHMVGDLSSCDSSCFETYVHDHIGRHTTFECMYILNDSGMQVTETITPSHRPIKPKSLLFRTASKGTDQSSKDYFQFIDMGLDKFITDPYVSLASGNLCITISVIFMNCRRKYILCIDAIPDFIYT